MIATILAFIFSGPLLAGFGAVGGAGIAGSAMGLFPEAYRVLAKVAGIALLGVMIFGAGFHTASEYHDAEELRAQIAATELERDAALGREASQANVIAGLQKQDARDATALTGLRDTILSVPIQSTQNGAPRNEQALLDDRCYLTERGARGLR